MKFGKDFFIKNKWVIIGIVAIIIIVVIGVYVTYSNSAQNAPVAQETNENPTVNMKPEDIGLTLTPSSDSHTLTMHIGDVSKFNSYDYTVSYNADEQGQTVLKGVIGSGKVKSGESSVDEDITLGTCSSGTCRYDKGITKIDFVLKLTLKNGKTGAIEDKINL